MEEFTIAWASVSTRTFSIDPKSYWNSLRRGNAFYKREKKEKEKEKNEREVPDKAPEKQNTSVLKTSKLGNKRKSIGLVPLADLINHDTRGCLLYVQAQKWIARQEILAGNIHKKLPPLTTKVEKNSMYYQQYYMTDPSAGTGTTGAGSGGAFHVIATSDLKKGDPIHICYGLKGDADMLLQFGFVADISSPFSGIQIRYEYVLYTHTVRSHTTHEYIPHKAYSIL